ncbi:Predicted ATPase (DUF699) [gamma proteobacterium HdN1]|nr:Predicted ATPase (DUF699) [gamma proteobacterium HdN1]
MFLEASQKHERRLLVLEGERGVLLSHLAALWPACASRRRLWVGVCSANLGMPDWLGGKALSFERALKTLGSEQDFIVFDVYAGFHPDAFCALAGTLVGGGVMVLMMPSLETLEGWHDPDYLRMLPYGVDSAKGGPDSPSHFFLSRLVRALQLAPMVMRLALPAGQPVTVGPMASVDREICELPLGCGLSDSVRADVFVASAFVANAYVTPAALARQQEVLTAIEQSASGSPVPIVITADRGRGKSALLGQLAARWQGCYGLRVAVCAALPQAAQQVFDWAAKEAHRIGVVGPMPAFFAPDALLELVATASPVGYDALFIDEAAMLPLFTLQSLIERFPRVVLASTQHGYEGTGRGLAIKLFPWLRRHFSGWRHFHLDQPMRWASSDPLEPWLSRLFFLRIDRSFPNHLLVGASASAARVVHIPQQLLASDELILTQVFELLASAHYRTTPSDLRDLLDGPNLKLWALLISNQIVGVCLVAMEGGFQDAGLCREILAGKRRPRGHLLPQIAAFHLHSPQLLAWRAARVVRITVAPELQGRGFGSRLLSGVVRVLSRCSVQWWGSSFALDPQVYRFWEKQGLKVLRIGASRESVSGLPSCLVGAALGEGDELSNEVHKELETLQLQWQREAVFQHKAGLLPDFAFYLTGGGGGVEPLSDAERVRNHARMRRFADGGLPLESALGVLMRMWHLRPINNVIEAFCEIPLNAKYQALWRAVVPLLQGEVSLAVWFDQAAGLGRKQATEGLRRFVALWLEALEVASIS